MTSAETKAALGKGKYTREGRVVTNNEFKRTNRSFVVL